MQWDSANYNLVQAVCTVNEMRIPVDVIIMWTYDQRNVITKIFHIPFSGLITLRLFITLFTKERAASERKLPENPKTKPFTGLIKRFCVQLGQFDEVFLLLTGTTKMQQK